mmetsp:Transcript_57661/g.153625  ORF Transcript_57661/g.153625 Transcript_57661/m.153625 type:complete len:299 (-) Transcript_57661:108-1004(-)
MAFEEVSKNTDECSLEPTPEKCKSHASEGESLECQPDTLSEEKLVAVDDDEPTVGEQCRDIATGTLISAVSYGVLRLFNPSQRTEDLIDLAHSVYSAGTAMYGFASMRPHHLHIWALPPHLSGGRGPIVRLFKYSLGYFGADVILILVDVLFRNKFPHLWAGRLGHHIVQCGANCPAIFRYGCNPQQMLAWRSVLCTAYIAELSTIFLRLSNMLRNSGGQRLRILVNWTLVVTFLASRNVNFAVAIAMFVKARSVIPTYPLKIGAVVQTCGYLLSTGWFVKILQIALKTTNEIPSIEC